MNAAFGLQVSVRELALDEQSGRLDPGLVARLDIDDLAGEAVPLDPALIHPEQHIGPVARFGAAGAGVNYEKGVRTVELATEELEQLEVVKLLEHPLIIATDLC